MIFSYCESRKACSFVKDAARSLRPVLTRERDPSEDRRWRGQRFEENEMGLSKDAGLGARRKEKHKFSDSPGRCRVQKETDLVDRGSPSSA